MIDLQEIRLDRLHDIGHFILGRLYVVSDADVFHLALLLEFARHFDLRFPVAQVMNLQQLHFVGLQPLERVVELRHPVFAAGDTRQLGREKALFACPGFA